MTKCSWTSVLSAVEESCYIIANTYFSNKLITYVINLLVCSEKDDFSNFMSYVHSIVLSSNALDFVDYGI